MKVNGKTVWITGASSGIGKACAIAFAQRGCKLILSARNEAKLAEVKLLCTCSPEVHILPLDVEDHDSHAAKTSEAISKTGEIDIFVNNAGVSQRSTIMDSSLAIDKKLMDVNFFGNVGLTRELLPHLIERKTGAIVVTSSVAGKIGSPQRCAYSASKFALHGWYDVLRAEAAPHGIQVNVVCPGYIKTDISINALSGDGTRHGTMDDTQAGGNTAEECAEHFVKAVEKNWRESYIGGKEIQYVKLKRFFPNFFFKTMEKMVAKGAQG